MRLFLPLALCVGAPLPTSPPRDHPRIYLASVMNIPLRSDESIESFSFATWGVEYRAICHIPRGWRIKAGASAALDGVLEGEGSQGATWFNHRSPPELRNLVLIVLYDAVQRADIRNGPDATFKGYAMLSTETGERKVSLDYRNIRLVPARSCR